MSIYAEYVADCAARGKKDEAEKQKELIASIAVAVDAALAARQGLPMITKANVDQKKAKSEKQNLTAPPETDSDAAGDHGSSSDSDSAPPSPASKAKAKRLRQTPVAANSGRASKVSTRRGK